MPDIDLRSIIEKHVEQAIKTPSLASTFVQEILDEIMAELHKTKPVKVDFDINDHFDWEINRSNNAIVDPITGGVIAVCLHEDQFGNKLDPAEIAGVIVRAVRSVPKELLVDGNGQANVVALNDEPS